jgi:hypothetical protein
MFNPFASGFNPDNIIEITGKIKKLTNVKGIMIPTIAAIIKIDAGDEYEVRLGPMMFIRNMKNFSFRKGAEIDVIGSQIENQGQRKVIIATKITLNGKETVFRDEMGIPVWAPISRKSGGGMMGGGGMMKNNVGKSTPDNHPYANTFPGEPSQQIHMSDIEDPAEEAEDIQGGKIPGGYK